MKKTLAVLVLAAGVSSAQTTGEMNFNGTDLVEQARQGMANMPAVTTPTSVPAFATVQRKTGPTSPTVVSSVEAFALDKADLAVVLEHGAPAAGTKLAAKFEKILGQVYYAAGSAGAEAKPKAVRVVSWNINDPLDADKIADITAVLKGNGATLAETNDKVDSDLAGIAKTDVFLIQEIPLPAAIAAAKAKGYSVVWAPEFIEIGNNAVGRDPGAAQVLTGNAILSKYPLSGFEVLRFARQSDWYKEQNRSKLPTPEKVERGIAAKVFNADIREKEVRAPIPYGGRLALSAQASIPYSFADAKGEKIRIVDIHLESAAKPDVRRDQMAEVVDMISAANQPTVFGGDLNTHGGDGRIQTVPRIIAGQFDTKMKVAEQGASLAIDFAGAPTGVGEAKMAFDAWKYFHSAGDPSSVFNREHQLFDNVKKQLDGVTPVNETNKGNVKKYKNTWSTPSPKHLGVAVLDFMWVYDPMGNLSHSDSKVYSDLVRGSVKKGAKADDYLSDHFPVATTVSLTDAE
ncbi:MAG: endonuclease/exonuclease/phosphatase family protein [Elusimicrobiota bacterium]